MNDTNAATLAPIAARLSDWDASDALEQAQADEYQREAIAGAGDPLDTVGYEWDASGNAT